MTKNVCEILYSAKREQGQRKKLYREYYYTEFDFICCDNNGFPYRTVSSFLAAFSSYVKNKLPFTIRFHDLRHTHATLLLEAGISPKVIQERLGHEDIRTTMNIYSHMTKNLESNELDKFEDMIK